MRAIRPLLAASPLSRFPKRLQSTAIVDAVDEEAEWHAATSAAFKERMRSMNDAELVALNKARAARVFDGLKKDVLALPEVVSATSFTERLVAALNAGRPLPADLATLQEQPELVQRALTAAMATTHLHTQSRIAAYSGNGFYTIGPCGEELLSVLALALRPTDPAALHYRHLGCTIARQMQRGMGIKQILLDRARGYTIATSDPVTGGVHCSLGGDPRYDFLVTSTLASQGPQAVGRALAIGHLPQGKWPTDAISFVSCGDGSINNSEWLSAVNAAEYIEHRRRACPVLFAISDNGLSISLKGAGWASRWVEQRLGMSVYQADGSNLASMLRASRDAAEYVRTTRKPATLLLNNLSRRFGHAATDRQAAYLSDAEIRAQLARDPVVDALAAAIHAGIVPNLDAALEENIRIGEFAREAFAAARAEPREMTEAALIARCGPQRRKREAIDAVRHGAPPTESASSAEAGSASRTTKPSDMRQLMTRAITELMGGNERIVYVGEDVEHGGYYRVSEGLKGKFGRRRCFDWPPDEASLVGAGIGLAQAGRLPIIEIPYAAYLSCGYNQFVEACFLHWLSDGKQPNGMVFRMQGFDEGIFGGHFHTANGPPVFGIPGLDVLCFSNGRDWARGLRSCLRHAEVGGVSMLLEHGSSSMQVLTTTPLPLPHRWAASRCSSTRPRSSRAAICAPTPETAGGSSPTRQRAWAAPRSSSPMTCFYTGTVRRRRRLSPSRAATAEVAARRAALCACPLRKCPRQRHQW